LARRQITLPSTFTALGLALPALFLSALVRVTVLTLGRLLMLLAGGLTARHLLCCCQ
jgi:hypothetical protein